MKARPISRSRRGTFIPILAICTVALFAFISLAIDLGMLAVVRTECQQAADAAALTGARLLNNKSTSTFNNFANAKSGAETVIQSNQYLQNNFSSAQRTVTVGKYTYNTTAGVFEPSAFTGTAGSAGGGSWTAVQTSIRLSHETFFAKFNGMGIFGIAQLDNGADAIAVHRPRDIAIVLDFSGSMGYDSTLNWHTAVGGGTNPRTGGFLNPDPNVPKFGHYGRYTYYSTTNANTVTHGTVGNRSNPLWNKGSNGSRPPANFTMETQGGPPMVEGGPTPPSKISGTPEEVDGFYTVSGDPAVGTVNGSTTVKNAFKMWAPKLLTRAVTSTLTPAVYDFTQTEASVASPTTGGYDSTIAACPAPPNFEDQSDSPIAYVGDKWMRTNGELGPDTSVTAPTYPSTSSTARWSTLSGSTFTDKGVKTLSGDVLGSQLFTLTSAAGRSLTGWSFPNAAAASDPAHASNQSVYGTVSSKFGGSGTQRIDGGNSIDNYRDAIWENYGYDLDMRSTHANGLRSSSNGTNVSGSTPASGKTVRLRPTAERFKGFSMGPGYWGKTFFIWPPDPRWGNPGVGAASTGPIVPDQPNATDPRKDVNGNWICDWRKRFFLRGDGNQFTNDDRINRILFQPGTDGGVLCAAATAPGADGVSGTPGYYRINYAAIIAWLKSGPQVLPTNLRAGRIVYYSSMPNDPGPGDTDDRRFWQHYIHYILGVGATNGSNLGSSWTYGRTGTNGDWPGRFLAGTEISYPFGTVSVSATATTAFDPSSPSVGPNPKPYMNYSDNINRPRAHFWFGPLTMTLFLEREGEDRPWWSGTVREAQCWQLKAAINSVLDDIKNNHPNDSCGMSFFAARSHFDNPMAPMGQDWFTLKNTLFFRKDTVAALKPNPTTATTEHRPYSGGNLGNNTTQIPNGSGATDPQSGMSVAYNLLSSYVGSAPFDAAGPYGDPANGFRGRTGASKIVIFETDGVPNNSKGWDYVPEGKNSRYTPNGTSTEYSGTGSGSLNTQGKMACEVARRVVLPVSTTTTGEAGYSLPNAPARVYSIGFGYLFEGFPTTNSGTWNSAHTFLLRMQKIGNTSAEVDTFLPTDQVIVGPYQRPDPTQPVSSSNPAGRIEKLRTCLERIFQSGVQVTLIE